MTDAELRDTGRQRKIEDEKEHMSAARSFDSLVTANMQMLRMLHLALWAFLACGMLVLVVTVMSAYALRQGQEETRHLIRTLDHLSCSEKGI
jgi:type VI protein secretion system component VasF